MSIKSIIRKKVGPLLQKAGYRTGLMWLLSKIYKKEGAIILMYHSVADNSFSEWIDPANHVPADVFKQQMEFLSKYRNVISLSELVLLLQEGKNPPANTVVITFDDGYLDNLTIAAPVLDQFKLTATLFLPTGYIERGETQWVDQVYSIFKYRSVNKILWGIKTPELFNLNEPEQLKKLYRSVCSELITSDVVNRKDFLQKLSEVLMPISAPPRLTMNWDEVNHLISDYNCFEIGAHTREHTDLTSIPIQEAEVELSECRNIIKNKINCEPYLFSFCYGRTSEELRKVARLEGFYAACGGEGLDPVIQMGADLFRLPRIAGPSRMEYFDMKINYQNTGVWRKLER